MGVSRLALRWNANNLLKQLTDHLNNVKTGSVFIIDLPYTSLD